MTVVILIISSQKGSFLIVIYEWSKEFLPFNRAALCQIAMNVMFTGINNHIVSMFY